MVQNEINRSEIVFMYDVKFGNPNGDPLDENRPRIDEATHRNLVSDVRLKRTIRDYLYNFCGFNGETEKGDIFVRETIYDDGNEKYVRTSNMRAEMFNKNEHEIIQKCIDIRLFGCTITLGKKQKTQKPKGEEITENSKTGSLTLTGPIQFKIGTSLHEVDDLHVKGTGAFTSSGKKDQNTFREEYVLPYSFILFEGIINENNADKTGLTNKDIQYLIKGMWNGTKMLITRSKYEHNPRVIIKINYKDAYHIGDLDTLFSLKIHNGKEETKIRGINDFGVNLDSFLKTLEEHSKHIRDVEYIVDGRVEFLKDGVKTNLKTELEKFHGKPIIFEEEI